MLGCARVNTVMAAIRFSTCHDISINKFHLIWNDYLCRSFTTGYHHHRLTFFLLSDPRGSWQPCFYLHVSKVLFMEPMSSSICVASFSLAIFLHAALYCIDYSRHDCWINAV